jgi:secreted trypsin-like serine protease
LFYFQYNNVIQLIKGDSGGGLAVPVDETWTLVGIVSVGKVQNKSKKNETCDLSEYVFYTDVAKFYNWIAQVIMETDRDNISAATNEFCSETTQNETVCYRTSASYSEKSGNK